VSRRDVWLVLPDQLSARLFFDSGIVAGLRDRLGDRLVVVFLLSEGEAREWAARVGGARTLQASELLPEPASTREKIRRRLDYFLDRHGGYYPLAIRLNYRHGFHLDRMGPGHQNWMLDSARAGRLPRWAWLERTMTRWFFSPRRSVPKEVVRRMREECGTLVLSNVQPRVAMPFLLAARRLGVPIVAHVASWDHTVGKGVIAPFCDRYVVQNRAMEQDLERYHGISGEHVVVTGWPQTDVYFHARPREEYESLLRSYGLDPARRLVVVMGNTPTNAPYEDRFVERLVTWWDESARDRFSLLFRPHPRDREWRERFAAALDRTGVYVQEASFTDFARLATLLQHCDCVVANAGTILLEALVNDRPVVCVLYDEGGPPGESWALKNVLGEHYRQLASSDAFLRAERFEDVVAGIERALADPEELADERRRIAQEVVGDVDGRAAERVVEAIARVVDT
jgi:UDP-N-acetylglucosamine:LPS N-acetylglucosamine transferase